MDKTRTFDHKSLIYLSRKPSLEMSISVHKPVDNIQAGLWISIFIALAVRMNSTVLTDVLSPEWG